MADMKLRHGCVLGCGVLHVLFAIAMIICGILLLVWNSIAGPFAVGFWGGFWVLITGVVGVVGGLMKKKGLEIAFLVLSILNCVFFWWIIALISGLTGIIENGCENTVCLGHSLNHVLLS